MSEGSDAKKQMDSSVESQPTTTPTSVIPTPLVGSSADHPKEAESGAASVNAAAGINTQPSTATTQSPTQSNTTSAANLASTAGGDRKDSQAADDFEDDDGLPGPPPNLTPAQKATIEELRVLQGEHEAFENEYVKEWNALKLKYLLKFRPLYTKRRDILCDKPTEPVEVAPGEEPPVGTLRLPNFWLIAMKNHRTLEELIRPHDEPVLSYLEDIRSEWLDDDQQTSFRLIFSFAKNPYFDHETLTKTYHMEKDDEGEAVFMSTEGTKICWHPGKDVSKVTVTKKQRNLKTRQTRIVKEKRTVDTFFDFFNSYEFPTPEQFEGLEAEEAKHMEDQVEAEFDVGCILREKIIPRALGWYMGEEDDEVSDEDSDMDDSDDSDDYDDDDDDSADTSEEAPPPRGGRGRRGHR